MTQRGTNRLTPPIGKQDHARGPVTATLTLVEYGDYECPYCRAAVPIVEELLAILGEHLCLVYRHFPIARLHPHAFHAAEAAEAAGAQGQFWEMHAYLFEHQQGLSDEHLIHYATDLGLDAQRFQRELAENMYADRVREDFSSGIESGVDGTPTFYLDGTRYDKGVGLRQLLSEIRQTHPELTIEATDPSWQRRIPRVVGQRSHIRPGL